jgi:hypothetical protein
MPRKVFGDFSVIGDTRIDIFTRELKLDDVSGSVREVFCETGAFRCRIYFAEFICGRVNDKYHEIEIPNTREWGVGFFFYGTKLYTLDEVRKEAKNSLPILADYLKIEMDKRGCDLAVKLRSTMFEPFSSQKDTLIQI